MGVQSAQRGRDATGVVRLFVFQSYPGLALDNVDGRRPSPPRERPGGVAAALSVLSFGAGRIARRLNG